MDIFTAIKKDHRAVQKLLKELTDTKERAVKKRAALLSKITEALLAHNEAEEKVFYPRVNANRDDRVLICEGKDEHALGALTLRELAKMDPATEAWSGKAKVLKDLVEHHIKEEEGEVHPAAKKILSKQEAVEIAAEFEELKEKIKDGAHPTRSAERPSELKLVV